MTRPLLPPMPEIGRPRIATPEGACDTHFHVIGPRSRFPFIEQRAYTPEDGPIEEGIRLIDALGMARGVAVQAHPHGTDNSAILDALARNPTRLRASAIVHPGIPRAELKAMADAGVRALRFHHVPGSDAYSPVGLQAFRQLAPAMIDLGLHLQIMMDANALESALPHLEGWPLPVVVDHMGNVDASLGAGQPAVQLMCRLLGEGRIWVKVSGTYRISRRYPDYEDARPIHEALVRANPDQIVWGSDWPHTRLYEDMPEDAHLLDLFNEWTPDARLRTKILVDNPAKLYFSERPS